MLRPKGAYRIVGQTKLIADERLLQIADILGIKNLGRFETVTIEFVKKRRNASKKKKAKEKR